MRAWGRKVFNHNAALLLKICPAPCHLPLSQTRKWTPHALPPSSTIQPPTHPHHTRPQPTKATSVALLSSDIKRPPLSLEEKAVALAVAAVATSSRSLQTCNYSHPTSTQSPTCSTRAPLSKRFLQIFQRVTQYIDSHAFRRMFRMTRRAFCNLLTTLSILLYKPHQCATNYRRETITADVRLGATLRMLAGAEVLHVRYIFQIGNSTASNVLHDTVDVMNSVLRFPKLPTTGDALHAAAREFKHSRSQFNPLDRCVGALDGICIKLKKPKNESIPASFHCRNTTLFLSRPCVILTLSFVTVLVFAPARHTTLLPMKYQGSKRR